MLQTSQCGMPLFTIPSPMSLCALGTIPARALHHSHRSLPPRAPAHFCLARLSLALIWPRALLHPVRRAAVRALRPQVALRATLLKLHRCGPPMRVSQAAGRATSRQSLNRSPMQLGRCRLHATSHLLLPPEHADWARRRPSPLHASSTRTEPGEGAGGAGVAASSLSRPCSQLGTTAPRRGGFFFLPPRLPVDPATRARASCRHRHRPRAPRGAGRVYIRKARLCCAVRCAVRCFDYAYVRRALKTHSYPALIQNSVNLSYGITHASSSNLTMPVLVHPCTP